MSLPTRHRFVAPGSPAERSVSCAGDEVVRLNGEVPRDIIEWRFLVTDDAEVELDVRRGGLELSMSRSSKADGEPLGAEVSSAALRPRAHVRQPLRVLLHLPTAEGPAPSLYLKDDDYRLSFLYGNFTTLTRFTEADLEREVTKDVLEHKRSTGTKKMYRYKNDALEQKICTRTNVWKQEICSGTKYILWNKRDVREQKIFCRTKKMS